MKTRKRGGLTPAQWSLLQRASDFLSVAADGPSFRVAERLVESGLAYWNPAPGPLMLSATSAGKELVMRVRTR